MQTSPGQLALRVVVVSLTLVAMALPAVAQRLSGSSYRIGPKDLLAVRVFDVPELGNVERRVTDDGTIDLPIVGSVAAGGFTEGELAARIKQILEEKYVQNAAVTVEVKEFRSRPIMVLGAVKSPGNLGFAGRWTLLEAIAAAGGLAEQHGDLIYVVRRAENGLSDQVAIAIADLMVKGDPEVNIPIFPNDLVNVPAVTQVTVFFLGEVATRGAISFRSDERITVLTGIARAGGLTDRASSEVLVKRRGGNGQQIELKANFKRILAGREADLDLQEGDVVVVKESFF